MTPNNTERDPKDNRLITNVTGRPEERELARRVEVVKKEPTDLQENHEVEHDFIDVKATPVAKKPLEFKIGIVEGARDINTEARDIAEERMTASQEEMHGVKGFFGKIWKHNWFKEYYRQKEIVKARAEIIKSNNIYGAEYAPENPSAVAQQQAMAGVVDRFISDFDDSEVLQAGELRSKIESSQEDQVKTAIKKLITDYASKVVESPAEVAALEAEFLEERNRIINWVDSGKEEDLKRNLSKEEKDRQFSYADNILEIAKQVRQAVERGESLNNLDIDLEVTIGKAKAGVKTEAQFNAVDRIVEKMSKWPITRLVNEATLAAGVSIAYSAGTFSSQRVVRSKILAIGTFGATAILGGGLAAARERVRTEEDRRSHFRSMAKGKTFSPDKSPRRKEMQEFAYEMRSATELADTLENSMYTIGANGKKELKKLSPEEIGNAIAQIAEIEARQKLADQNNIDLISFSDPTKVEQERTRLLLLKAQAKVDLRRLENGAARPEKPTPFNYNIPDLVDKTQIEGLLRGKLSNEADREAKKAQLAEWIEQRRLQRIGGYRVEDIESKNIGKFTPESAAAYKQWDQDEAEKILQAWDKANLPKVDRNSNFDQQLAAAVGVHANEIQGDREQKDRLFAKMKSNRTWKAARNAIVVGVVVGASAQEFKAFFSDSQLGLVEHGWNWLRGHGSTVEGGITPHLTALEGLRHFMSDHFTSHHEAFHTVSAPGGTHFKLPESLSMEANPGGHSYSLYRGDQLIDRNIMIGKNGIISPETKNILAEHGVVTHINNVIHHESAGQIIHSTEHIAAQNVTTTANLKPEDYIKNHPELVQKVHREFWYDNNTEKFDKNELRLNWGGVHGTGLDKAGNIVYSIKGMRVGESFHGDFKINPLEAAHEGKLRLLLSLSRDTQAHPFEVPIDKDGNVIIDPASKIAKMFFQKGDDGQMHFIGKYAEVAEVIGVKDGVEQVRILATDVGKGIETITDQLTKETPAAHDVVKTTTKEILKTTLSKEITFEDFDDYKVDPFPFIPIIGRTPLERLDYINREREGRPIIPPYNFYPEINPAKREEYLKDMSPRLQKNPDAVLDPAVEIPWYFKDQERRYPGYIEELKRLSQQIKEPMGKKVEAVVCLAVAGHQEAKNIYRCLETYAVQVDKAGKSIWRVGDNKQEILLYINYPTGTNADETIKEIGRFKKDHPEVPVRVVIEEITNGQVEVGWYKKKIFDLALLRKKELGDGKDIAIIANDADTTYSSPEYLDTITTEMSRPDNENIDAMLGRFDLSPEVYDKNPTFHAIMRFWQYMETLMRTTSGKLYTQGRNTILRGSSYAAIGGNRTKAFWADIEFGQLIHTARAGTKKGIAFINRAWVAVDPRREIDKFKGGEKIAHTWFDFDSRDSVRDGGKAIHKEPENIDLSKLAEMNENDPLVTAWTDRLTEEFQSIVDLFGPKITKSYGEDSSEPIPTDSSPEQTIKIIRQAARFAGVKLEINKGGDGKLKIKITDTSKLREQLLAYHINANYLTKIAKNPL